MKPRMQLGAAIFLAVTATACCSAQQPGQGYWMGEYRSLQEQFHDFTRDCTLAKKEWSDNSVPRYDRWQNWVTCANELNGNVLILDFGQPPANNSFGGGIGLQGKNSVSFVDSQRHMRTFKPQWKIVGDSSVTGAWTAFATGNLYLVPHIPPGGNPRRFDNPHLYFFGGSQQANSLAYFGEGEQTPAMSTNYSMRRSTSAVRADEPIWDITPLHYKIRIDAEFASRWYDVGGGPAPSVTTLPLGSISPGLPSSLRYLDESFILKAESKNQSDDPVTYETGAYLLHSDDLEARFMNRNAATSTYSYRQFWIEEEHDIKIRCRLPEPGEPAGPRHAPRTLRDCFTIQLTGSMTESAADGGKTVPFFLQPTVGGSDVNNLQTLPSYANYRFRAPNVEFAHVALPVLFKYTYIPFFDRLPDSFYLAADSGKAALRRDDLSLTHMRHSYSAGATLNIGNFAAVALYYSWGGHEGGLFQHLLLPPTLGDGNADFW